LATAASSEIPRIYKATIGWTMFSVLGSLAMVGVVVYLASQIGIEKLATTADSVERSILYFMVFGMGLYFLVDIFDTLRFKLTLSNDTITVRRAWGTRQMARSDVAGWKEAPRRPHGVLRTILLCPPKDSRTRRLSIPLVFKVDEAFTNWLSEIPQLGRA
jgi:hypothetical protein